MNTVKRLAKIINVGGICSRRKAEILIQQGKVKVNSQITTNPITFITSGDVVEVNGQILNQNTLRARLWLYYKPRGVITTHHDPENRPTVFDTLPASLPRVISIGRLDIESEGLLLLTNSGSLARQYELPKNAFRRIYKVKAYGYFTQKDIDLLQQGVKIEGIQYLPAQIEHIKTNQSNSWFKVTILEGKNREIRKLFNHIGLQVNKLIRIEYGPYKLGNLKSGQIVEGEIY